MKILVTGGAGFIGTNLIKRLKDDGNHVVVIDDYSTGDRRNHIEGVKYINADIEQIEYIKGKDIDLCYHLAAQSRVQPSFDDPTECLRVNVNGTEKVMEWADNWDIRVVYAGSSSKHHDPTDSPYAMYKYLGEEVCKLYRNSFDVNVRICRFYNVYGPGESLDEKFGNVIGIWRTKSFNGEKLPIVGDGEQRRDFTHINDIINGCILAWKKGKQNEYMLGTKKTYSINEIAKMFKTKIRYISARPGERFGSIIPNNNAKNILGYSANIDIKDYIKNFIKNN